MHSKTPGIIFILIFIFLFSNVKVLAQHAPDTVQRIILNRFNDAAQEQKPYVILISADGFRTIIMSLFQ